MYDADQARRFVIHRYVISFVTAYLLITEFLTVDKRQTENSPCNRYEGPEGVQKSRCTLSLTSALDWVGG